MRAIKKTSPKCGAQRMERGAETYNVFVFLGFSHHALLATR
jgi:hypothetical protein